MAKLTAAQRRALPSSAFAGPGRSYPVNGSSHARNALSRASQYASPAEQRKIAAKVHRKYPSIGDNKPARHKAIAESLRRHMKR